MSMGKINIFLADDHAIVREGLKRLIEAEPDLALVGEAEDGEEVVAGVQATNPDVVVLDISMPGRNGVEVARLLRERCPNAKVLVLTVHEDSAYARESLAAGALGYMLKRAAAEELIPAIKTVASGKFHADEWMTSQLMSTLTDGTDAGSSGVENLSDRELEVLRLLAKGYSNKEVAATLHVSVKTIETYKVRSMEKLGLRSRVDLVRHANKHGWLRDI
jgi:DNA-binding NarL/FixJ family response regulator